MAAPPISGAHQDSKGVAIRGPDGTIWSAPADQAASAIASGTYRPVSTDELAAHERAQERETLGFQAQAFGAGALRGATLGLSDVAGRALGAADRLSELREGAPEASIAGEVAGGVASAFIPGGLLARAGQAAGAAARGGKIASTLLRTAAEGAIVGAGAGVSEVALSREPQDAGEIARTLAIRGAEGAGLGALTGIGFLGLGAAASGLSRGARALSDLGRQPSRLARAAAELEALQGQQMLVEPIARRAQLQSEIESLQPIAAELKLRGKSDLLSDVRLRQDALKQELKAVDAEILQIDAIRPKAETVRTTRDVRQRDMSDIRQKEMIAKVAEKIRKGEDLGLDDQLAAIREQRVVLKANENNVNVAIDELRSNIRRRLRADDPISQQMDEYYAYLWEQREIIRRADQGMASQLTALREGAAEAQGRAFRRTVEAVSERLSKETGERLSKETSERLFRETGERVSQETRRLSDRASREVETITRRVVAPEAKAAAALAREEVLQRTRVGLPADVLTEMKGAQTRGDLGQFLAWRSASTLLGFVIGDVPGALIGSIAGARGGEGIQRIVEAAMPTLSRAAPFARALGERAAVGARRGGIRATIGVQDLERLAPAIADEANDPESIYSASYSGYRRADIDPLSAQMMAQLQAGRAQVLRDALPTDPASPRQRRLFTDVYQAASDPRGITDRIANKSVTEGDMRVLDAIFPTAAAEVRMLGRRLLDMGRMRSRDKAYAEMLAYGRSPTTERVSRVLDSVAQITAEKRNEPPSRLGSQWNPEAPTTAQRIGE